MPYCLVPLTLLGNPEPSASPLSTFAFFLSLSTKALAKVDCLLSLNFCLLSFPHSSYLFPIFTEMLTVMLLHILDIFFVIFHTSLILFNLFGWIWKRTRRMNLIILSLTGVSWLFLGLLVGTLGYCPLTEWHFTILEKLGKTDLPSSYIKYLADRLTGSDLNTSLVDKFTLYGFLAAFIISIILNVRYYMKNRNKKEVRGSS
jgi:hypothetical protein